MAEGPNETPTTFSFRRAFLWTEIFRCFQVALDPRKLLVAAIGVLVMSLGWYLLSRIFYHDAPIRTADEYSNTRMDRELGKKPDGSGRDENELHAAGDAKFLRDYQEWRTLNNLAGPNGRLRTLPWYEYRGQNPFLLITSIVGGVAVDLQAAFQRFLSGTLPVLVEPLFKFLLPVVKLFDPNASALTRLYRFLCMIWSIAGWAFFGGVITRIAAVQFAGRERITLSQAFRFVGTRYLSYLCSPLVPIGVIILIVIALAIYGLVAMIPILGDVVLYGLFFPVILLGGIAMAVLLVGLVGYPLMYTTVSAEGSDTFDALSRAYNYVFQAPWSYLWYSIVAILYGAAVILFVVFMGSLMIYLAKWGVSQAPWSEASGRKPDFLFIWAPESFGWRELLLEGSPLAINEEVVRDPATGREYVTYLPENADARTRYVDDYRAWNWIGASLVTFWLIVIFMLVIGFSYSYFWSAATMIYLLMRRKVDETDLDEVYVEEEQPEIPSIPPTTGAMPSPQPAPQPAPPAAPGATSLPMVSAPPPAQTEALAPTVPPTPPPPVTPDDVTKPLGEEPK
jgi:hypothetical protein